MVVSFLQLYQSLLLKSEVESLTFMLTTVMFGFSFSHLFLFLVFLLSRLASRSFIFLPFFFSLDSKVTHYVSTLTTLKFGCSVCSFLLRCHGFQDRGEVGICVSTYTSIFISIFFFLYKKLCVHINPANTKPTSQDVFQSSPFSYL